MSHDQEKWDQRYRDKPMQAPAPSEFIREILPQLKHGTLLDIASGDGSTSLFLAQQGFKVTAADISATALQRQTQFASALGVEIKTLCCDLNTAESLATDTAYDCITLTRYRPSQALITQIISWLKPEATLAISAFTAGINPRFCLRPGELKNTHPKLELVYYRNRKSNGSALDEYLFRRRT